MKHKLNSSLRLIYFNQYKTKWVEEKVASCSIDDMLALKISIIPYFFSPTPIINAGEKRAFISAILCFLLVNSCNNLLLLLLPGGKCSLSKCLRTSFLTCQGRNIFANISDDETESRDMKSCFSYGVLQLNEYKKLHLKFDTYSLISFYLLVIINNISIAQPTCIL